MRCLQEAELLRYLDGYMPSAVHDAVQQHLQGCVQCAGELQRVATVGNRVDACLAALVGPEDLSPIDARESLALLTSRIHERPRPMRAWALVWAAAVVATCIVVIALGIHRRRSTIAGRVQPDMHATTTELPQTPREQPRSVLARPVRAVRGRPRANKPRAMADYLSFDSGAPIQMGVVVRVTLPATAFARLGASGSGNLQADVLVGDDGIAHAIRLVPQE